MLHLSKKDIVKGQIYKQECIFSNKYPHSCKGDWFCTTFKLTKTEMHQLQFLGRFRFLIEFDLPIQILAESNFIFSNCSTANTNFVNTICSIMQPNNSSYEIHHRTVVSKQHRALCERICCFEWIRTVNDSNPIHKFSHLLVYLMN